MSAEGKQPVLLWAVGRVDWSGPWLQKANSTAGGRRKGGFLLQVIDGRAWDTGLRPVASGEFQQGSPTW